MVQLTQMNSWKELERHSHYYPANHAKTISQTLSGANITLEYTTPYIDDITTNLLLQLAYECQLESMIEALFLGEKVNTAERKPALHTALRMPCHETLFINGRNIISDVSDAQEQMREISNKIRAGQWLGYSNKPITDIVNIGIGGSQLGPAFCIHAFAEQAISSLAYHFISDIDPIAFTRITNKLNPETTLFIISSKSFTTTETLYNLKKALAWVNQPKDIEKHFIAITAYTERANEFGIKNTLPIWDWVGGRYSICSAINLITCIAVGFEAFSEFLQGAYEMDEHFRHTPFRHNLPVQLALLGIWTNNFLKIHQLLLLTYGSHLDYFTSYIQQLDMESNGKSFDKQGRAVNYATGPIIWGGSANQAQHSYYQLLCQGTHRIAVDLISVSSHHGLPINQLCLAQKESLSEGFYDRHNPNSFVPGAIPINHIRLKDNSPRTLGSLIALYEHKIYVQSIIWHINAFDQPGVESSKRLLNKSMSYA